MIDQPGIYTISAEEYHADCCPTPSLSASIATILIQQSPLHAKSCHPRLTENPVREEAAHLDLGRLAHSLMLEGDDIAVIIQADNYRTKAAQETRDAARLAGKCPLLAHEMVEVTAMMSACRAQLDAHKDASDAFRNGKPEQVLVWKEFNGIWCRARLDWLHDSYLKVDDYKTGAMSAHPDMVSKRMCQDGRDIQAAFYLRGVKAVCGTDALFRFIVQENFQPFALSVATLSPSMMSLAEEKVEYAIDTFGQCLRSGIWPGYPDYVYAAELPPWEERAWLDRPKEEA